MKKRIFATLLAAVMTIASAVTAFAAEVPTSFLEVTYKFECTTFVAEDTITVHAQENVAWQDFATGNTYNVTGTGEFEMTAAFNADQGTWTLTPTGFKNMGYLSSANSVANIYTLKSIVIEGVEFAYTVENLDASGSSNGWANIWGGFSDGQVIASSAKGSQIVFNATDEVLLVQFAEADFEEPETTTTAAPTTSANIENQPTGDAADYTMALAFVALAAAGVLFFNKKIVVNE